MKSAFIYLLVLIATAKADIDWSTVYPNHILDVPHMPIPNAIPDPRITGGVEAVPNSIPFQVALFIPTAQGTAFCGGSLISRQTVLTAAHCVDSVAGAVLVVLGAHRVREEEPTQVRVNSSGILVHPNWSATLIRNDVALIRLPEPVTLSDAIQIVTIATDEANSFEGHTGRASGWGLDSDEATAISPILRQVDVPVISNSVCNVAYFGVIQDTHICTSGLGGRSTCSGDSGGPLIVGGVQIGIVSFGIALGCEIGWPSAYTRITSFADWINYNLV